MASSVEVSHSCLSFRLECCSPYAMLAAWAEALQQRYGVHDYSVKDIFVLDSRSVLESLRYDIIMHCSVLAFYPAVVVLQDILNG